MGDHFLFIAESDIASYIDHTTLYPCQNNLFDVQRKLESESTKVFQCFHNSNFKTNNSNPHAMLATDDSIQIETKGSLAKRSLSNFITILYPESFMLCKKEVHNCLSLELYTPFDFQLRT